MKSAAIFVSLGLCACWNPTMVGDSEPLGDTDVSDSSGGEEEESGEPPAESSSSTDPSETDTMEPDESSSGEPESESSSEGSTTEAVPVPACGNLIVEGVEECDDANGDDDDACLSTCELAACGDGFVQTGVEACDDGNVDDGDGCQSTCQIPGICEESFDPGSGALWVVCATEPTYAWVSSQYGGGFYHPEAICEALGYTGVAAWTDNCDNVCGSCVEAATCDVPGDAGLLPWSEWSGGPCGADAFGELLCGSVTWLCG